MNADFTLKPAGASASTVFIRPTEAPGRGAVPTELPADQSVAQADRGAATQNDTSRAQTRGDPAAQNDRQSRQTLYDNNLAQVIYRVVDSQTRRVVRQVPDQAMLRLRAYSRALQSAEEAAADRKTLYNTRA